MKNIHKINMQIYITNNEEIKKGDFLIKDNYLYEWFDETKYKGKKVIITDNPNLIKEGIQEIPTDFLEWFVNNPSCESVEVEVKFIQTADNLKDGFYYQLLIPQDQPKQTIEGWEKNWEIVNSQLENGVNPHAYRLGYLSGYNHSQTEIDELRREKDELVEMLQNALKALEWAEIEGQGIENIKQLITKHK